MESDEYGIVWPVTRANTRVSMSCPGEFSKLQQNLQVLVTTLLGHATRLCNDSGDWKPSNVTTCTSYEYIEISLQV